MYRKFEITDTSPFEQESPKGNTQEDVKKQLLEKLQELYRKDTVISAEDIANDWFPTLNYNIFISHSHKDKELAQKLAAWLENTFQLKAFIDSDVWGNRVDLINALVKPSSYYCEHCPDVITKVDTILKIALTKMMDKTECFFFLNTNNSLPRPNETDSAWIYYEIETVNKIRCKKPFRQIQSQRFQTVQQFVLYLAKLPRITFPVSLNYPKLGKTELDKWARTKIQKRNALDTLYNMFPICDPYCDCFCSEFPCDFFEIERCILDRFQRMDSESIDDKFELDFYRNLGEVLDKMNLSDDFIRKLGKCLKNKYGEFLNTANLVDSRSFARTCKDCKKYRTWSEARKCLKKNKG